MKLMGRTAIVAAVVVSLAPVAGAAPAAPKAGTPGKAAAPAAAKAEAAATVAGAMAEAARKFLAGLSPDQRKRAAHDFADPDRQSFEYVPLARSGLPLKALDAKQRQLAHALLKTGLAERGYHKVTHIIELETVLAELERNPIRRDPENYYFWVFGEPKAKGDWGWKVEGHHLSFNFTVVKGTLVATTPSFMGANPAEVRAGALTGRRVMGGEEDLARQLATSFGEKERAEVIFDAKAPPEILTGDRPTVTALPEVGIAVAAMTPAQRELLRRLLAEYAAALPAPLAAERLARVDAGGFEKVRFGWAGALEARQPHYYRIAGPSFVLEYDNTQDGANHIHSVWRDFAGDFGRDLLREHIESAHRK